MSDPPRLDPRTLARYVATLNARWLARAQLPSGQPLTYTQYRRLLQWVLAEHLEGPHADRDA